MPKVCYGENGVSYRGPVFSTLSGKTCQRWDRQEPHDHDFLPQTYPDSGLLLNYCRNPGESGSRPWCLTTDPGELWDYCNVPECGKNCVEGIGETYRGNISHTQSNIVCQSWNSQVPHQHDRTPENYTEDGLVENYCRNPGLTGARPWCLTSNPSVRWEYCNVPRCGVSCSQDDCGCGNCNEFEQQGSSEANATTGVWSAAWGPYPGAAATSAEEALSPSDGGTWQDWQEWSTGSPLPDDYDSTVSPVELLGGKSLPTSSGVKIRQVNYMDEEKMELSLMMTFKVAWSDVRLQGLSKSWVPVPSHLLWLPPFRFGKSVIAAKEARSSGSTQAAAGSSNVSTPSDGGHSSSVSTWLSPDGQVSHSMARDLRVQCPVDLHRFPVDTQECLVELHAYGGTVFELSVTEDVPSPLSIDLTNVQSQYVVTGTLIKASVNSIRGQDLPCEYFSQKCSTKRDADLCAAMRYCDTSGGQCQQCAAYIGDCRTVPTNCSAPSGTSLGLRKNVVLPVSRLA
ncbi:uncharacterized protein LOC144914788 [Branchiostoma floridae x Branchiostoma belcheri]